MIIRSKAPLRLGLAGGGTDLEAYANLYGGAILNATINLHAHATILPRTDGKIIISDMAFDKKFASKSVEELVIDDNYILHKGIYNRIVKDFIKKPLSFELITAVDAPPGSGLGSSSTLVVAILGAFCEWLKLPLGEYDIAKLAYQIEREDLRMPGGKQDQYAATFGGVNFMEFYSEDKVIVNPLRINDVYLNELSFNLVLYYTKVSRTSSKIIETQKRSIKENKEQPVAAMHKIKETALMMKEALLKGEFDKIGEVLSDGWFYKKRMAPGITNAYLDEIYDIAMKAGATGGKISGAGGGGFMVFYCPNNSRSNVINALKAYKGKIQRFDFTNTGLISWSV